MALASAKGSPGVTTLALALASVWPRRLLVAELDPAGGDLAARLGLDPERGTQSLAAAARRRLNADTLLEHCQPLGNGAGILVGPLGAPEAAHVASILVPTLTEALGALDGIDLLVDCGRLASDSAVVALAGRAVVTVLLSRPDIGSLTHAGSALSLLQPSPAVVLVLVGKGAYPQAEVAEALEVDVLGVVAHDAAGADLLTTASNTKAVRRSLFLRSVADLADTLGARLPAEAQDLGAPARSRIAGARVLNGLATG